MTTTKNYDYGNGGHEFSKTEIDHLTELYKTLTDKVDAAPGSIEEGAAADIYKAILDDISITTYEPSVPQTVTKPKPGVDLAVYNWIAAAGGINAGTSAAADLVAGYTYAISTIRGDPKTPNQVYLASAKIGLALANGIIKTGLLPDIIGLGAADAGSTASTLFNGIYSPWAGTALFSFFKAPSAPNGAPFYADWLLTADDVTGAAPNYSDGKAGPDTFTFKQYTGTYELISALQAYKQISPLTLLGTLLAGTAAGDQADPSPLVGKTQDFLWTYYGRTSTEFPTLGFGAPFDSTTRGEPVYHAGTVAGETITISIRDQVIAGGPNDDTVVVSQLLQPPLIPGTGSRLLDGGSGSNTLAYTRKDDITVKLQKVQRSASAEDPTYTGAPKTVLKVLTSTSNVLADYAYNFQTVNLGSGKNTFSVGTGMTKNDLLNKDGTPVLKSLDGGSSSENTLDLRDFGDSLTVDLDKPANNAMAPYTTNIRGLMGDGVFSSTNFQLLKLGSGDDTFKVVDGVDFSSLKIVDGGEGANLLKFTASAPGLSAKLAASSPAADGTPTTAWVAQTTQVGNTANVTSIKNFQKFEFDTVANKVILSGDGGGSNTLHLAGSVQGTAYTETNDTFDSTNGLTVLAGDGQNFTTGSGAAPVLLTGDRNTLTSSINGHLYVVAGSNNTLALPDPGSDNSQYSIIESVGQNHEANNIKADYNALFVRPSQQVIHVSGDANWIFSGAYQVSQSEGQIANAHEMWFGDKQYWTSSKAGGNNYVLDGFSNAVTDLDGHGGLGPVSIISHGDGFFCAFNGSDTSSSYLPSNEPISVISVGNHALIEAVNLTADVSGNENFIRTGPGGSVKASGTGNTVSADCDEGSATVSVSGSDCYINYRNAFIWTGEGNSSVTSDGTGTTATGNGVDLSAGSGAGVQKAVGNNNTLSAYGGGVTLQASGTGNVLRAGGGSNNLQVLGSGGGNTLQVVGDGNNTLSGGTSGTDTADYSAAFASVVADLGAGTVTNNGFGGADTLASIHSIVGSMYGDTIAGTPGNDVLDGHGGLDTIFGGGGGDTYIMRQRYGLLTVDNSTVGGTVAQGEVDFGAGITEQNLWFTRLGDDLVASVLGSADAVDIRGWFSNAPSAQVATFKAFDGLKLDNQTGSL